MIDVQAHAATGICYGLVLSLQGCISGELNALPLAAEWKACVLSAAISLSLSSGSAAGFSAHRWQYRDWSSPTDHPITRGVRLRFHVKGKVLLPSNKGQLMAPILVQENRESSSRKVVVADRLS